MATPTDRGRLRLGAGSAWLLAAALVAGGGPAQVAPEHRDLVLRLATGTSTRDPGVIDRAAADVDRFEAEGALSDGEKEAFRSIIAAARAGEWDRAQDLAYALRDAQEPTAEDRKRVEDRVVREVKKLDVKRPSAVSSKRRDGGP